MEDLFEQENVKNPIKKLIKFLIYPVFWIFGKYNFFKEIMHIRNTCYACKYFKFVFVEDGICEIKAARTKCLLDQKLTSMFDCKCSHFERLK
jgi:hypothetical protein